MSMTWVTSDVGDHKEPQLLKMYGPPRECKKNWVRREAVCENVSGL